jgi:hypothetical protein
MNTPDTTPANEPPAVPETTPALPSIAPAPPAIPLSIPGGLRGWLFFLGISNLSTGIISCLTVFGIFTGIPLIVAGIAMIAARSALEEPVNLNEFMRQLRTSIIGISALYILSAVLFLLTMMIVIPLFGLTLSAFFSTLHP